MDDQERGDGLKCVLSTNDVDRFAYVGIGEDLTVEEKDGEDDDETD